MTRDGSPFDCDLCTDKNRIERNCFNCIGLSDDARAVEKYSEEVKDELKSKGAKKVIGLFGLRLYECPLSYLSEETFMIIRLVYLIDSSSTLLFAGGLGSQPAWLIEAYELYKMERLKSEKDYA